MIPEHVISKAIAGRWKYRGSSIERFDFSAAKEDGHGFIVTKVGTSAVHYEQIALDPDFWAALGKKMGWPDTLDGYEGWKLKAVNFYRLILRKASQEEIDNFWKTVENSLAKNNKLATIR